jgi:hypothetical protein
MINITIRDNLYVFFFNNKFYDSGGDGDIDDRFLFFRRGGGGVALYTWRINYATDRPSVC